MAAMINARQNYFLNDLFMIHEQSKSFIVIIFILGSFDCNKLSVQSMDKSCDFFFFRRKTELEPIRLDGTLKQK